LASELDKKWIKTQSARGNNCKSTQESSR